MCQLGGGGPPGGFLDDGSNDGDNYQDRDRGIKYSRELFQVSPSKIIVPTFSGTQLNSRPYMPFNKAIKKLMEAQGSKGLPLLTIVQDRGKYGERPYDNDKLVEIANIIHKVYEYNVAIQIVLETYTTDVAENMIRYGVHNWFDASRKLYHHHTPSAEDLQQILIQELFELKPVSEADVEEIIYRTTTNFRMVHEGRYRYYSRAMVGGRY